MSESVERLLERAAERIASAEERADKAVAIANRVSAANIAAMQVMQGHQTSVAKLKAAGNTIFMIEFVEGIVETIARDMKAALTGKRPDERFDA